MIPTENEIFSELLERYKVIHYDPDKHLLASTAGKAWGISAKAALQRLRDIAEAEGLTEIKVMTEAGQTAIAFVRKTSGDG